MFGLISGGYQQPLRLNKHCSGASASEQFLSASIWSLSPQTHRPKLIGQGPIRH